MNEYSVLPLNERLPTVGATSHTAQIFVPSSNPNRVSARSTWSISCVVCSSRK